MDLELLFSVIDFKMYKKDRIEETWFDLEGTSNINVKAKIVPLFNTMANKHHIYWDQSVAADVKLIVNLVKTENVESEIIKEELISFESPLEQFDSDKHIYEFNIVFNIDDVKKYINRGSLYSINISYILVGDQEDVFETIDNNTFFRSNVPFSKDGEWFNGEK